jgi:hypothetical protein
MRGSHDPVPGLRPIWHFFFDWEEFYTVSGLLQRNPHSIPFIPSPFLSRGGDRESERWKKREKTLANLVDVTDAV